jgi:hypothetical protein
MPEGTNEKLEVWTIVLPMTSVTVAALVFSELRPKLVATIAAA